MTLTNQLPNRSWQPEPNAHISNINKGNLVLIMLMVQAILKLRERISTQENIKNNQNPN